MIPKILIVEDEVIVAEDLKEILVSAGYEVVGLSVTAKDAVEKAKLTQPDLILMDIMLNGGETGIDAANQILNTCYIPIIYITAYKDKELIANARETKPYAYIVKPFEVRDVIISIKLALYKQKINKKLQEKIREVENIRQNSVGNEEEIRNLMKDIAVLNKQIEKHERELMLFLSQKKK